MTAKAAATRSTCIENNRVLFPPKFAWPRCLPWARVLLAAVALATGYLYLQPASPVMLYGLMAAYLGYAIFRVARGGVHAGILGLLALFGDTVYFLIMASSLAEKMLWLGALYFLFLLTEGLVFSGPVEVAIVVGVSAIFCTALPYGGERMERTVLVGGALACAFAVSKRRQTAEIERLTGQLADARKAAEKAGELERMRIASDFHDGPLQSFISLQMRLEILRKLLDRDINAGLEDLRQLQALAKSQIRDLRAFLHSMRPVDVDGANLEATARRTAETFQKESGIPVTFLGTNTPVGLPQEMTTEVLQMLREALHNVQKHSGATRVAVAMEKKDRFLEISVDDNGHGFNFAGTYSLEELELLRLGPASLKRRARSLGAELSLESRPGSGAGVKVRIPLQ